MDLVGAGVTNSETDVVVHQEVIGDGTIEMDSDDGGTGVEKEDGGNIESYPLRLVFNCPDTGREFARLNSHCVSGH